MMAADAQKDIVNRAAYLVWGYVRQRVDSVPKEITMEIMKWIDLVIDSVILTNDEKNTLRSLLSAKWSTHPMNIDFNLLFRASRDGMAASEFYKRCGVENTLCIIQAQNKEGKLNVIGGFTTKKWDIEQRKQHDNEAFLHLIRSSEDYPPQIFDLLPGKDVTIQSYPDFLC